MISFEDLVQRFPTENVPPYGASIVIPGTEFDPDWEDQLCSQGCRIHLTSIDGKAVTLVQKGRSEDVANKIVSEPNLAEASGKPRARMFYWSLDEDERLLREWPRARGDVEEKAKSLMQQFPGRTAIGIKLHYKKLLRDSKAKEKPITPTDVQQRAKDARHEKYGDDWRPEEDLILIELHKKKVPYRKIAKEMQEKFPNRTDHAIFYRISALLKQGKIKPRFERRKQRPIDKNAAQEPAVKEPTPSKPMDTPMDTPTQTEASKFRAIVNVQIYVDASNQPAIENLLKFLREVRA
jgi:hypothetical protein